MERSLRLCRRATICAEFLLSRFQPPALPKVDSSIGGKTGVDFDSYKNMVGAFLMPKLVYTNIRTLLTLPGQQVCLGLGRNDQAWPDTGQGMH